MKFSAVTAVELINETFIAALDDESGLVRV